MRNFLKEDIEEEYGNEAILVIEINCDHKI